MPMTIEAILEAAKKMAIGDRQIFTCDHVPSPTELQYLAIDIAKHHKKAPTVRCSGKQITINLVRL